MSNTNQVEKVERKPELRNRRIERSFAAHFGFDCGPAFDMGKGLVRMEVGGTLYQAIKTATASNEDLLNGISVEGAPDVLLVRVSNTKTGERVYA